MLQIYYDRLLEDSVAKTILIKPDDVLFQSGAKFSSCEKYRYCLWRRWGQGDLVMFIGLNPSTADHINNDPTVTRCINFAKRWGFDGLMMMNAYGFRSTDPKGLKAVDDPNGPENDAELRLQAQKCKLIIAAWGVNCPENRQKEICKMLGSELYCLGKTKHGFPKHPLYLRSGTKPEPFYD